MSDKNNIEDFFNNSLDGFDREPRDLVWENLDERLDMPLPFWKTPHFWGFTTAALLVTLGLLSYFSVTRMNDLQAKNQVLVAKKLTLTQELKDCSASVENSGLTSKTKAKQNGIGLSKNESEIQNLNNQLSYQNAKIAFLNTELSNVKKELNQFKTFEKSEVARKAFAFKNNEDVSKIVENQERQEKKLAPEIGSKSKELPLLPFKRNLLLDLGQRNEKCLNSLFVKTSLDKNTKPLISSKKVFRPDFRFGVTAGTITTFTELNSTQELGWNGGLSLNLQLLENFGLTGEIKYNRNHYGVSLETSNQFLSTSFPHANLINRSIKIVSVSNYYFDLPIGLKFSKKIEKLRGSLYVNPGVAWQLYLPQQFVYDTADEFISLSDDRYFAYFGSAFLNIGFEKKINRNLTYQLGFWGEKGLVEYGLEGRNITNLGIKGTLFFGAN